jgi:hypothetical protein
MPPSETMSLRLSLRTFSQNYGHTKVRELLGASLVKVAAKIQEREISSEELVRALI